MGRNNNRQGGSRRRRRQAYSLLELLTVIAILALLLALLLPVFHAALEKTRRVSCANNLHSLHLALAAYLTDNDAQYPPDCAILRKHSDIPADWSGKPPYWFEVIAPYLNAGDFPSCPDRLVLHLNIMHSEKDLPKVCGYAYNALLKTVRNHSAGQPSYQFIGRTESAIPSLTDIVVFFDARAGLMSADRPDAEAGLMRVNGLSFFRNAEQWSKVPPGAFRHDGGANYLFGDGHLRWLRPEQLTPANFLRAK